MQIDNEKIVRASRKVDKALEEEGLVLALFSNAAVVELETGNMGRLIPGSLFKRATEFSAEQEG